MTTISREALLSVKRKTKTVDIDGLGSITLQEPSVARTTYFSKTIRDDDERGVAMIFDSIIDPPMDPADFDTFKELPIRVVNELSTAFAELTLGIADVVGESETPRRRKGGSSK